MTEAERRQERLQKFFNEAGLCQESWEAGWDARTADLCARISEVAAEECRRHYPEGQPEDCICMALKEFARKLLGDES